MEHLHRVVNEDAPDRCEAVTSSGQCRYNQYPGSKYCSQHGGTPREATKIYNYNLTKFKSRIADFATNPAIKSLREEVGVLRMMLEARLNACNDNTDLMLASTSISNMVLNIERLVNSCHKLEINLGQLLDRNKALQLADELIQIITSEIKDDEATSRVALQINTLLNRISLSD